MQVKKLLLTVPLFLFIVNIGQAAITSIDNVFVANDQYSSDFYSRLNRDFQQILNGGVNSINNANIVDDSLTEAEFADEINPRVRTYEGAACEFVYTGLLPVTGASLTQNTSAGTAYPRGFRINKASATAHSYTASKWTWVDIDQNGDFQYSEQAIGSATPSVATNSIRLARVSTDATTVGAVLDMRKTSCTNGPFSIISDSSGEATLSDILKYGYGGWESGLNITTKDSHSVYVNQGAAYINGEYRVSTGQTTVDGNIVASPLNGTSGIDTGALTASTNYYVYGVADLDAASALTGVLSTSYSAPSGSTNYRRLGEVSTDASAVFSTSDVTSVDYHGKIRQIKRFQTGSYSTGANFIPNDDTIPQCTSSEGDQFMSIPITPTDSNDMLKIDVVVNGIGGNAGAIAALCQDTTANALASTMQIMTGAGTPANLKFTYFMRASTTSQTTFKVRAGDSAAGTFHFNGTSTGRKFGGTEMSSITITEYAQ